MVETLVTFPRKFFGIACWTLIVDPFYPLLPIDPMIKRSMINQQEGSSPSASVSTPEAHNGLSYSNGLGSCERFPTYSSYWKIKQGSCCGYVSLKDDVVDIDWYIDILRIYIGFCPAPVRVHKESPVFSVLNRPPGKIVIFWDSYRKGAFPLVHRLDFTGG